MGRSDNPPRQPFHGGAGGSPLSPTTFRFPCRSLYHIPGGPGRSATPTSPLGLQLLSTSSLEPHELQQTAWPYILGMCLTQPHCGGFALIVLLSGVSLTPQNCRAVILHIIWGLSTSQEAPSTLSFFSPLLHFISLPGVSCHQH